MIHDPAAGALNASVRGGCTVKVWGFRFGREIEFRYLLCHVLGMLLFLACAA